MLSPCEGWEHVGISGKWCLKWVLPFLFTLCAPFLYLPGVPMQLEKMACQGSPEWEREKAKSELRAIHVGTFFHLYKLHGLSASIEDTFYCILYVAHKTVFRGRQDATVVSETKKRPWTLRTGGGFTGNEKRGGANPTEGTPPPHADGWQVWLNFWICYVRSDGNFGFTVSKKNSWVESIFRILLWVCCRGNLWWT